MDMILSILSTSIAITATILALAASLTLLCFISIRLALPFGVLLFDGFISLYNIELPSTPRQRQKITHGQKILAGLLALILHFGCVLYEQIQAGSNYRPLGFDEFLGLTAKGCVEDGAREPEFVELNLLVIAQGEAREAGLRMKQGRTTMPHTIHIPSDILHHRTSSRHSTEPQLSSNSPSTKPTMGVFTMLVRALQAILPNQTVSEVHSILAHTLIVTLLVSIQLSLLSAMDVLVSFSLSFFGIPWNDRFCNLLLWFLNLPLSAKQQKTSEPEKHLPTRQEEAKPDSAEALEAMEDKKAREATRERSSPSFPTNLLVFFVSLERGLASKTGAYAMDGFSLFSLWQLCRLAAVAVPRGAVEGFATWTLLREGLWYFRTRFGSHDIAEQEAGSLECTTWHRIPEPQEAQGKV
ncbi:uncharacterized protein M437DRAFT_64829 [Aureobasidium melanogenum CBS 110374]|uniref:Uncharacterized protein n=1 Tax=Aureobasidium melanogenum (strain CBS 110374) TaxID=1043003 RepID=A0A074VUZ5_AURM1|nr:uncharacterized protein M437DRAFT_64829 [Aureobasidium melanogenum CBS 110374]KEQ64278.1 hypothetical protein M437DRAFT_64829 [Aureobasidium melanogenum CBS 110374]